ncbi:MAG: polyprenyl synthetase family protein [Paludibacter sp.]|jgi:octaprenyl-diphosphate synthase
MNYIDNIRKPIQAEMQLFGKTFAESLSTDNELLLNVNEFVLQKSGKQLRPMIVLLSAKLCGTINKGTIDGAVSLELLHTASLIHDDVVDYTLERRGNPSVNDKWTNKIAVLSGDYIFSKSLTWGIYTKNLEIMSSIAVLGEELADGELLQISNNTLSKTSEENYYSIIRKKTALLFATCAEVGSLSVNADESSMNHLHNFGEYLGICFQIKDDIFDYYEDIQIGKPTGNDIRDGKVTLPLIYALQHSEESTRNKIVSLIENKDYTPEIVQTITRFTHENGGVIYAEEQMDKYKNKAIEELNGFVDSDVKKALILCAEFAASRKN